MAKKTIGFWGIDIGQCALKAIRLELQGGKPVATAYDYIEHPKILSQPDADPDALTRESLEKFLSRNPVGRDMVAMSIAGQSGLARFVKLPPVEEKKIPEIVKFEAKQQIPFPLDEVVWDFQKIAGGDSVGGFAMETEIGLFAMKRDVIARALAPFTQVKSEVHLVQMAPLALCNFATYEVLKKGGPDAIEAEGAPVGEGEADDTPKGKRRCSVVLDIGTDNSNLIITDGGKIIWQRPVPLGGNHFTRALTKELKLTFAKAEHLKRNAAKSPELAQILRALRPVLTEFVGEVQRSLGYFTNTHRDAHVAYMVGVGNAFRLPGLQKYLAEKLSLEVKKPSRLDRVSGDSVMNDPNFQENLLTFPIALGLALQGLELARLQTNLLPHEIRVERLVRAKKPWAAAAAAGLLLGAAGVGYGYAAQLSAVSDPGIAKAITSAGTAVNAQKAQEAERTAKEAAVASTSTEVKTIISGNDERLNWVRLNEVLTAALPRPADPDVPGDPKANLNDPDQLQFWRSTDGGNPDEAYRKYKRRMSQGIPIEKVFDDDQAQYLAMVNIESVYCRYEASFTPFLANADKYVQTKYAEYIADVMLDGERDEDATNSNAQVKRYKPKPPDGGGWIVEIRGYTYHNREASFIKQCFVRNLQRFDRFAAANFADPKSELGRMHGHEKVSAVVPGGKDPILVVEKDEKGDPKPAVSTISHPFLLFCKPVEQSPQSPIQFQYIGQPWIDGLISGTLTGGAPGAAGEAASLAAAPPSAVPGAPPVAGPAPWVPLGSANPATPGAGVVSPYTPPVTNPSIPTTPGKPGSLDPRMKTRTRYEFVVCFLWKEPAPSSVTPAK